VDVPPGQTRLAFRLDPNAPNPFTSSTRIRFLVPERARTTLRIYDLAGRRVSTLVDAELAAGPHTFRWEGLGDDGRSVGPGVYFCQLQCGRFTGTRRMLMLR
jgi:FlgD Ig-like domain